MITQEMQGTVTKTIDFLSSIISKMISAKAEQFLRYA